MSKFNEGDIIRFTKQRINSKRANEDYNKLVIRFAKETFKVVHCHHDDMITIVCTNPENKLPINRGWSADSFELAVIHKPVKLEEDLFTL